MLKISKSKLLTHVISNAVILALVAIFAFVGMLKSGDETRLVSNSEYKGTIYAGDKSSNNVSLMINVYWGTEYVEAMLEIFEKNDIKCTFFVGGTWAKENKNLLIKMYEAGHEIASHGYSHKEMGTLGYEGNYSEIKKCHDIVYEILGMQMELFAPPGGSYNSNTTKAAGDLGYKTIMWTRDTIDWRDKDANLIYNRAVVDMKGGDLILMHPTACTVEALENIINYAKNHGLSLTTVSQTLGL